MLWSHGSTLYIVFGTHRRHVLQADEEKDHSYCYQSKIPKPATVMVCAVSNDMSKICEGTITAERSSRLFQRCHILHVCQQHGFLVKRKGRYKLDLPPIEKPQTGNPRLLSNADF